MPLPPRASGPYRPTRLGQWEVVAKIAGGGMSAVYLGRHIDSPLDQPNVVALKIARHDTSMDDRLVKMFLEEGKLIQRIVHPNIVRTLEVGADADQDYIAMELMLGKTFAAIHDTIAARGARVNPDIAAWAAARVADALHYAHELTDEVTGKPLNLVHRDVNPQNIFATFRGEVKLFDFGLAKVTTGDTSSSQQMLAGKLSYLSPEQVMQIPVDRRSDIFSLGTTLWELLTAKRLFRRDSDLDTVRAVQLGPIPDIRSVAADLPEELARITKTALERNRDHRYPNAAFLARDLDNYVLKRVSAAELAIRLSQLIDNLFPGEAKKQGGWLKPAVTSAAMKPTGGPSQRPAPPEVRRDSRETTAVMHNAPVLPSTPRDGVVAAPAAPTAPPAPAPAPKPLAATMMSPVSPAQQPPPAAAPAPAPTPKPTPAKFASTIGFGSISGPGPPATPTEGVPAPPPAPLPAREGGAASVAPAGSVAPPTPRFGSGGSGGSVHPTSVTPRDGIPSVVPAMPSVVPPPSSVGGRTSWPVSQRPPPSVAPPPPSARTRPPARGPKLPTPVPMSTTDVGLNSPISTATPSDATDLHPMPTSDDLERTMVEEPSPDSTPSIRPSRAPVPTPTIPPAPKAPSFGGAVKSPSLAPTPTPSASFAPPAASPSRAPAPGKASLPPAAATPSAAPAKKADPKPAAAAPAVQPDAAKATGGRPKRAPVPLPSRMGPSPTGAKSSIAPPKPSAAPPAGATSPPKKKDEDKAPDSSKTQVDMPAPERKR